MKRVPFSKIGLLFGLATTPLALAQAGASASGEREALGPEPQARPAVPRVAAGAAPVLGREVAVARHLADGQEFAIDPVEGLIEHGSRLFQAVWTDQEGGGRPLTKGTGAPVADPSSPLVGERAFNRISAPDANSCFGCHNAPFSGGGGDIVTNVFVLGQRFDFTSFDQTDGVPTRGALDEEGKFPTMQEIANSRSTLGMLGSGYIELLARQMTAELQALRDGLGAGDSVALASQGVSFGTLSRDAGGAWDTSLVEGLPAPSLASSGPADPPNLILRPFHQAGAVVSLRQFSNNAFNHHHGIQAVERFGAGQDPDGDGFVDEMTVADVTAVSVYQAALPVPGRVIPRDPVIEEAVARGEELFVAVGCADCHVPFLELESGLYSEPNPYNPAGNLRPGDAYTQAWGSYTLDLGDPRLPAPRLRPGRDGRIRVPAFTDLKLHDITGGPGDPNRELLDMQVAASSPAFFAGNGKFLTKKLWGAANEPPFFHHGRYTTLRQAIEAHAGEAQASADAWGALAALDRDRIVEFLKTLQALPEGTRALVVDEHGNPRSWRPFPWEPAPGN